MFSSQSTLSINDTKKWIIANSYYPGSRTAPHTEVISLRPLFFHLSPVYPSVLFHQFCPLDMLRAHSIKESPSYSRNPYRVSHYGFGTVPNVRVSEMKSTFFPPVEFNLVEKSGY